MGKTYTPLEVVEEIRKSLTSKLKEYSRAKAKAIVDDLEDDDNMPEIDTSPNPEKNVLQKDTDTKKYVDRHERKMANKPKPAQDWSGLNEDRAPKTRRNYEKTAYKPNLPKSEGLKKAKVDAGKDVMTKVKIRKERAQKMGAADRKRFQTTSERLKDKRNAEKANKSLEKSNYGPKGAGLYSQADNAKRKSHNVGDMEAGYAKIKIKDGANASGGQGKGKLNDDMRKLKAKNKKQPVTSLKDMPPEKQAKLKELYEKKIKKSEKLKNLLIKIREKTK